ncbi:MAG TPA: hypothetical protein DEQ43_06295 [Nocardioides bacterium]|nr:hypothetical protein [Nocardioides sp.]
MVPGTDVVHPRLVTHPRSRAERRRPTSPSQHPGERASGDRGVATHRGDDRYYLGALIALNRAIDAPRVPSATPGGGDAASVEVRGDRVKRLTVENALCDLSDDFCFLRNDSLMVVVSVAERPMGLA